MTFADFEYVWTAAHRALAGLSESEMDIQHRQNAMSALATVLNEARVGWLKADQKRQAGEEAVVLEAWREGRVTIRPRGESNELATPQRR